VARCRVRASTCSRTAGRGLGAAGCACWPLVVLMFGLAGCASAMPADEPGDDDAITVVIGGDCSFARGVAARGQASGWNDLFGASAKLLRQADLAIVNLESPLAPCLPGGSVARPRLCGDAHGIAALTAAGVDAVTVANNHALDGGEPGLRATVAALREVDIAALGVSASATGKLHAEDLGTISIVAANLTPAAHPPASKRPIPTPSALGAAIADARRANPSRPVLAILHCGRELARWPSPRDGAYARAAIAAGAAAVVMHGAHVVRKLVIDQGVPVHLGLGNLLFDQRDVRARTGALITLRLGPGRPAEVASVTCVDSHSGDLLSCDDFSDDYSND
jgi:poly-gamma-glutamate capsule biosynthesis protein CapA/YwtB (metallophosphatase superfamily)